jgi:hypothetical protein
MIDIDCGVHLMIEDATIETQYGTAVKIKFSVLGCTDPKQIGKTHTEIFNVDDGRVDMFLNIAEACGLITGCFRCFSSILISPHSCRPFSSASLTSSPTPRRR